MLKALKTIWDNPYDNPYDNPPFSTGAGWKQPSTVCRSCSLAKHIFCIYDWFAFSMSNNFVPTSAKLHECVLSKCDFVCILYIFIYIQYIVGIHACIYIFRFVTQ